MRGEQKVKTDGQMDADNRHCVTVFVGDVPTRTGFPKARFPIGKQVAVVALRRE